MQESTHTHLISNMLENEAIVSTGISLLEKHLLKYPNVSTVELQRLGQYANRANLTLSTLGKIFSRRHFEIFFLFFSENRI